MTYDEKDKKKVSTEKFVDVKLMVDERSLFENE